MTYLNQECIEKSAASFQEAIAEASRLSPMFEVRSNVSPWVYANHNVRLRAQFGWGADGPRNVMLEATDVTVNTPELFDFGRPKPPAHLRNQPVTVSFGKSIPCTRYEWELGSAGKPEDEDGPAIEPRPARVKPIDSNISIESGVVWCCREPSKWCDAEVDSCLAAIDDAPEHLIDKVRETLDRFSTKHAKWIAAHRDAARAVLGDLA